MGSIPLDLQRRFEKRWAARFFLPNPSIAAKKHELERQQASGRCERGALLQKREQLAEKTPPPVGNG
jgi:hypothetical protein